MRRLGLRGRVALAVVGAAVLAVALATLLGNLGLESRLNDAAHLRLDSSAHHVAKVVAAVYVDEGGFTPRARQALAHLAALDGLRLLIRKPDGGMVVVGAPPRGATGEAQIVVRGRGIGTAVVSEVSGSLLTPAEKQLRNSLDRLHLIAGAVAVVAALVIALLLAETLSRPLRRIRGVAERLERGELAARVDPGGDSEIRAVARALNRLAETLEHEEEIRKTSVADLGHELRTPVNGLLARIEAAQDGVLEAPENLEAMHADVLRLTKLLDDLSTLADAERPGLLLAKHRLDLGEVGRAVGDSFAPRFAEAGIAFAAQLEPVSVEGDSGRLEQVTANLLSNALRYTKPSGMVTLRVGRDGPSAFLEVEDTGIGIAPDDLRHIFTRFWRSDRSRSRTTGGSGIGLAVVLKLVRAHQGRVDVDSVLGKGSRFRVLLPAAGKTPEVVSPTRRLAAESRAARRSH